MEAQISELVRQFQQFLRNFSELKIKFGKWLIEIKFSKVIAISLIRVFKNYHYNDYSALLKYFLFFLIQQVCDVHVQECGF